MDMLISHAIAFIAGGALTALALHWLRKNKPAVYDEAADRIKDASRK